MLPCRGQPHKRSDVSTLSRMLRTHGLGFRETEAADNYRLDWQYDAALDGNIALTGGLDLSKGSKFTVALAFGTTKHNALSTLSQSLSIPFEQTREAFIRQWERTSKRFALTAGSNNSRLFERSVDPLLAHEDKTYPGAMIASLSIPWQKLRL